MNTKKMLLFSLLLALPFGQGHAVKLSTSDKLLLGLQDNQGTLFLGGLGLLGLSGATALVQKCIVKKQILKLEKEYKGLLAKGELTPAQQKRLKALASKVNTIKKINKALSIAKVIELVLGGTCTVISIASGFESCLNKGRHERREQKRKNARKNYIDTYENSSEHKTLLDSIKYTYRFVSDGKVWLFIEEFEWDFDDPEGEKKVTVYKKDTNRETVACYGDVKLSSGEYSNAVDGKLYESKLKYTDGSDNKEFSLVLHKHKTSNKKLLYKCIKTDFTYE